MPRPRFHKLDPERRTAILQAAMDEFATHGFDAASYNRIIERSGISKGAMYYYFDDKEDLYLTVIREVQDEFIKIFKDLPEVDTPEAFWDAVRGIYRESMTRVQQMPQAVALLRGVMKLRAERRHSQAVQALYDTAQQWTERVLSMGQAVGAVRDDVPFGLLIAVTLGLDEAADIWMMNNFDDLSPELLEQYGELMLDMFRRVVAPPGPGEAKWQLALDKGKEAATI